MNTPNQAIKYNDLLAKCLFFFLIVLLQLKHALEELNRVVEAKEEIEHRCRELDLQISNLQEEKLGFIQETARLNERVQQYENVEDGE